MASPLKRFVILYVLLFLHVAQGKDQEQDMRESSSVGEEGVRESGSVMPGNRQEGRRESVNIRSVIPGAYGDPHFIGWDGVHFDFTGKPDSVYCMFSSPSLHVNMRLEGEDGTRTRTWIKTLALLFESHRVVFTARSGADLRHCRQASCFMGSIEADGSSIQLVVPGQSFRSKDGKVSIVYERSSHSDAYLVKMAGMAKLRVSARPEIPDFRTEKDARFHLSVEMVEVCSEMATEVHGILGQTLANAKGRQHKGSYKSVWNPLLLVQQVEGPNGDGYLDGSSPHDYESSGLLHSDCRFSRFDSNFDSSASAMPLRLRSAMVSSGYARKILIPK